MNENKIPRCTLHQFKLGGGPHVPSGLLYIPPNNIEGLCSSPGPVTVNRLVGLVISSSAHPEFRSFMSRAPPYPRGVRNGESAGIASITPLSEGTRLASRASGVRNSIGSPLKSRYEAEGGCTEFLKCVRSDGREGDI